MSVLPHNNLPLAISMANLLRRKRRPLPLALLCAPPVFAFTVYLATLLLRSLSADATVHLAAAALVAAAGALGIGVTFLHLLHHWRAPLRRLEKTLDLVRCGQAPIDELSIAGGGLASLADQLQDVLRELRQQKAAVARLEHEMRQRVAQRTDALERVIGTLRQQSIRDILTGLYNRRLLEQHLPALIERCHVHGNDLCLLMIDVDFFKHLNDTLGHAAGDQFLRAIGQLIRSTIRDQDLAFRYGGDEFVVVLPGCDLATGQGLAQRLSSLVDAVGKTLHLSPPPGLSVGCATLSETAQPAMTSLLEAADRKLYEVKAAKRRTRTPPEPALAAR